MIRRELMRHVFVCLMAVGLAGSTGAQDAPAAAPAAAPEVVAMPAQPSSVTDAVQEVQAEVAMVASGAVAEAGSTVAPLAIPEEIPSMDPVPAEPLAEESVPAEVVAEDVAPALEPEPAAAAPTAEEPVVAETPAEVPATASAEDIVGAPTQLSAGVSEEETISVIFSQEEIKRKAYKTHLRQTLVSADAAMKVGRYEDAIGFYEESRRLIRSIGSRPEDRAEKDAADAGLAESYYRQALYLKKRGSYDEAANLARLASGMGHPRAPGLAGELRDIIEKPQQPKVETPKARWREPEYKKQMQEIAGLLRQGQQHMVAGEWDKARAMFEKVLAQDPENTEAIRMLEKIGNQRFDASTAELEATKASMIADVRASFNPRDYGTKIEDRDLWQEWEKKQKQQPQIISDRIKIIDKMKAIKIPEIDFRQANINDVITFLQQQSVECDDISKGEEERGVNIILNLSSAEPSARAAAPADPFSGTGAPAGVGGDVPPITFSARYISLYEALKIVTEVADLKFTVSGSVVMVMLSSTPERELLTRMYDVLPTVGDKIDLVAPAVSRSSGRGSGDFISMDADSAAPAKGDWKEFFANMGVGWPAGSSVKHIPEIGKIIVKNTPDNLTTFESVLSVLNVVPYQIEIESRFVEVGQDDLNSLGFEWNLTDNWEIATKKNSSGDYLGNQQKVQVAAGSFTTGMRYSSDLDASGDVTIGNDNLLTVASVLTNPELELVLHALQQKTNTDLLSAPKVTTQSGLEATLKVVTEYIYPTSFTLENNDTGGQTIGNNGGLVQMSVPVAVPENFETREVGVILSVLPEVSPEGQMINLTMSPEVVSEPEWFNYGAVYTDADGNTQQVNMPQPFFHTRSIQTTISVYNGATVVMGGLIAEVRASTEDKIPFLGDIPLIGRLFQSRYDKSMKKNLLIFVTARLVDPAGRPVKRNDAFGDVLASGEAAAAASAAAEGTNP